MSMFLNRLRKNQKRLKSYVSHAHTDAYRLYDRDIPEYPYIVDCYGSWVVLYEKGVRFVEEELKQLHYDEVTKAIFETLPIAPDHLVFKTRTPQTRFDRYSRLDHQERFFQVVEGPATFRVNLLDYLDTGLFLDHRPLRTRVYKESFGKRVLNLFSYTGSISVMAALGKALQVVSVDLSPVYQEWAKINFENNGLSLQKHRFFVTDTTPYVESAISRGEKFDLIILDPPTFSNSKKMDGVFDIEKDHVGLIDKVMRLLSKDGTLYFSTPFRRFKMDAVLQSRYKIEDITKETIPSDFHDPRIHHCFKISF